MAHSQSERVLTGDLMDRSGGDDVLSLFYAFCPIYVSLLKLPFETSL
jgi:hypothetical protein